MSGDLISLRVLVATSAPSQQDLWQKGAAMASVPIDFAAGDAAAASAMLASNGADICIVDHELPEADRTAVIAAARASQSSPLVFMAAPRGSRRTANVDGVVTKPATSEVAQKLVERCTRTKFPTRVLIVDDSTTMRSIVRKILAASRFAVDVQEAAEGLAALQQIGGGNFNLVFLDYNMPGLNGIETLSEIKRTAPNVSVVMMTSTFDNALAARAQAAGALAFLKKPFYPADIDAVLERHFGVHVAG